MQNPAGIDLPNHARAAHVYIPGAVGRQADAREFRNVCDGRAIRQGGGAAASDGIDDSSRVHLAEVIGLLIENIQVALVVGRDRKTPEADFGVRRQASIAAVTWRSVTRHRRDGPSALRTECIRTQTECQRRKYTYSCNEAFHNPPYCAQKTTGAQPTSYWDVRARPMNCNPNLCGRPSTERPKLCHP